MVHNLIEHFREIRLDFRVKVYVNVRINVVAMSVLICIVRHDLCVWGGVVGGRRRCGSTS